jgi:hypothetical protein
MQLNAAGYHDYRRVVVSPYQTVSVSKIQVATDIRKLLISVTLTRTAEFELICS